MAAYKAAFRQGRNYFHRNKAIAIPNKKERLICDSHEDNLIQ